MAPGIARVAEKRPLPLLRRLAAAAAILVLARILWEPRIVGTDVGTTPVLNWLLYGYGVPAVSFWTAGHLLRRRADDAPARTLEAAAILFAVLLVFLEIRHAMNGGDIYAANSALPNWRCKSRPVSPSQSASNGCAFAAAISSTMSARSSSPGSR